MSRPTIATGVQDRIATDLGPVADNAYLNFEPGGDETRGCPDYDLTAVEFDVLERMKRWR